MSNVTEDPYALCTGLILPLTDESGWSIHFRRFIYLLGLLWSFMGVAIVADIFMCAIEVITSKTTKIKRANPDAPDGIEEVEIRVWNDTVANLTLLALGSSAPEILLSIIEIVGNGFESGALGPSTIVGSAAFNLLIITAVCVISIPDGETRGIDMIKVFATTTSFSLFAYIWLFLVLQVISPNVVDIWEAVFTFICFPVLVIIAYMFDKDICGIKKHAPEDMELGLGKENGTIYDGNGEAANRSSAIARAYNKYDNLGYLSASHVDKKVVKEFMQEVGKHPDLDEHTIAKLITYECQQHEKHDRGWYRVNASRQMFGRKKIEADVEPHILDLYHKIKNKELPTHTPGEDASGGGKIAVVEFSAASCAVMENEGKVRIDIERYGLTSTQVIVKYETVDGTAEANSDYIPQKSAVVFEPGETHKFIEIEIVDDNEWEPDETFFVKLALDSSQASAVKLGRKNIMQVIIINDDEPGNLEFSKTSHLVKESIGNAVLPIIRADGCDGRIEVTWTTKDMEAVHEKDYIGGTGTLVFEHGEREKNLEIPIIDDQEYEKDESFQVELSDPTGGAKLGRIKKTVVTIINDDDYAGLLDRVVKITHVNVDKLNIGNSSYADQFRDAMNVNGGDVENATSIDYVMHFFTFGFKVIFAMIPPPSFLNSGGVITFFGALAFIAVVTAIISDLASIFGCLIDLDQSIVAITFVALGTSLPDLFASKSAAANEKSADASVGNVTGSNSVNVFLGLGLPWLIAAIYWKANNDEFYVPAGSLAFSVAIYTICALICISILMLRRYLKVFGKAELGGPKIPKYVSACIMASLWFIYILLSSLQVYGHIDL